MKAIETKYLPATNNRGSRIKATAEGGDKPNTITISYPHEFDGMAAHAQAALALAKKMNWNGDLIGGGLQDTYVFIFADSPSFCRFSNEAAK